MARHIGSVLKQTRCGSRKAASRRTVSAEPAASAAAGDGPVVLARVRDGLVLRAVQKPSGSRSQPDERGGD